MGGEVGREGEAGRRDGVSEGGREGGREGREEEGREGGRGGREGGRREGGEGGRENNINNVLRFLLISLIIRKITSNVCSRYTGRCASW